MHKVTYHTWSYPVLIIYDQNCCSSGIRTYIMIFPIKFPMSVDILRAPRTTFPIGCAALRPWQCTFADPLVPPTAFISFTLQTFFVGCLFRTRLRPRFPGTEVITFYDAVRRRVERVLSMTSTIICMKDNGQRVCV